ncbi:hypothetical protein EPUS_04010 [Endocarpon pusillum Z07020]|uniref:Rpr2-domain-containing protein n=1 Tax=Endocarpon pusillum (strain Z07020 / HMAS-L-300199) TaxID=1263415 RepID=U1HGN3_ENDPU|nr:uncharacterized protein EPUS_04010 [Endocarpon pusillum Z07020]ERF69305.1 hypothetical protein EPUS_04010 [Endocarpon pusillum Z07020]
MVKAGKSSRSGNVTGISQKHLHSRISYLYQAAVYLGAAELSAKDAHPERAEVDKTNLLGPKQPEEHLHLGKRSEPNIAPIKADQSKTGLPDVRLRSQAPKKVHGSSAQTHQLLTSMRSISQKSQIHLSQSIKRSICRRCNGLLTLNSTSEIENMSREGKKPCADVLVVTCCQCGNVKRYPVGMGEAQNRHKKKRRLASGAATPSENANYSKPVEKT